MQDKDTKKESKRVTVISKRTLAKPRKFQLERLTTDTMVGRFSTGEEEHIFVIDPEVVEPTQKK